jgi:hypothetical protein
LRMKFLSVLKYLKKQFFINPDLPWVKSWGLPSVLLSASNEWVHVHLSYILSSFQCSQAQEPSLIVFPGSISLPHSHFHCFWLFSRKYPMPICITFFLALLHWLRPPVQCWVEVEKG